MSSELSLKVVGIQKGFNLPRSPMDRVLHGFTFGLLGRTRRHEVLKGVSFNVRKGETIALLGVNGAGKSTLLQMVAGTMAPSAGHIEVSGKVAALLELGAGFSPDFTGRENAILNARLLGVAEDEVRSLMPWIIEFSGIGESIDLPVRHYSSGMFVRLAFAVAAAVRPDIMIIDEALGVGDAAFQAKCYQYLKHELGHVTKIIVSHDSAMVGAMAERVIVLSEGRVLHDGSVSEGLEAHNRAIAPGRAYVPIAAGDLMKVEQVMVAGQPRMHAWPGEKVEVRYTVRNEGEASIRCVPTLLVEDCFGQGIVGNDGSSNQGPFVFVPPGESSHVLSCVWPPLRKGAYVLRIGIEPTRFASTGDLGPSGATATIPFEGMSNGGSRAILGLDVSATDAFVLHGRGAENLMTGAAR
jgi:ABC-type polysaccharide/polyol phosphate transport system ATPase subunit